MKLRVAIPANYDKSVLKGVEQKAKSDGVKIQYVTGKD